MAYLLQVLSRLSPTLPKDENSWVPSLPCSLSLWQSLEKVDSMIFMVEKKHEEEEIPVFQLWEFKVEELSDFARAFAESPL